MGVLSLLVAVDVNSMFAASSMLRFGTALRALPMAIRGSVLGFGVQIQPGPSTLETPMVPKGIEGLNCPPRDRDSLRLDKTP